MTTARTLTTIRRHLVILAALAMVMATLALAPPAEAQGWAGFAVSAAPSAVDGGTAPAWSAAVTDDLGGASTDLFVNNHASTSEALVDVSTAGASIRTVVPAGGVAALDTHGTAFSDIDGDGDDDLFETSGRGNDNRLFRNDGGLLTQVNAGALVDNQGRGRQPLFVDFDIDARGLTIAIATDDVLFASGSPDIGGRGRDIIAALAPTLASFDNEILVEGHTDTVPLSVGGYDNWNLSADRALAVLKLLVDDHGDRPVTNGGDRLRGVPTRKATTTQTTERRSTGESTW